MTAAVRRDLGAGFAGPCEVVQFLLSVGSPRSRCASVEGLIWISPSARSRPGGGWLRDG
jgi:hypothetical protein